MSTILDFARELDKIVRRSGSSELVYPPDELQHDPDFIRSVEQESKEVKRGLSNDVVAGSERGVKAG